MGDLWIVTDSDVLVNLSRCSRIGLHECARSSEYLFVRARQDGEDIDLYVARPHDTSLILNELSKMLKVVNLDGHNEEDKS